MGAAPIRYRSLEELETAPDILTAQNIELLLKSDAGSIRWQAIHDPAKLGFPVSVICKRVKIPRIAFIRWYTGMNLTGKEN